MAMGSGAAVAGNRAIGGLPVGPDGLLAISQDGQGNGLHPQQTFQSASQDSYVHLYWLVVSGVGWCCWGWGYCI